MKKQKLQIAQCVATGKLKSIFEVESGLNCNCVVPGTTISVIAKNVGKCPNQPIKKGQRIAHFALSRGEDSQGAIESALHHLAKAVFLVDKTLRLPKVELSLDRTKLYDELMDQFPPYWSFPQKRNFLMEVLLSRDLAPHEWSSEKQVIFDTVETEVFFQSEKGDYRVDAVAYLNAKPLLVEFKVTHAVDASKREAIAHSEMSCLEIDLSGVHQLDNTGKVNEDGMRSLLLGQGTVKSEWIYNSKWSRLESIVKEEILSRAKPKVVDILHEDRLTLERQSDFYKLRKVLGFEPIKVYGKHKKLIYKCPAYRKIDAFRCEGCRWFGGHFYFTPKENEDEIQLTLCGFNQSISRSKLNKIIGDKGIVFDSK